MPMSSVNCEINKLVLSAVTDCRLVQSDKVGIEQQIHKFTNQWGAEYAA